MISERAKAYFLRSYINVYVEAEGVAKFYWKKSNDNSNARIFINLAKNRDGNARFICSPEMFSNNSYHDEFVKIAERNGDRSYDRKESLSPHYTGPSCCAYNYRSINVVCLNADWDSSHPKGSSLSDICIAGINSYADYVRSGYLDSGEYHFKRRRARSANYPAPSTSTRSLSSNATITTAIK